MRKIVDLIETAPGVWGMALRIARRHRTPEEAEASREAFFNSLAGKSSKRHYAFENLHWAWLVFGFYTLPIISAVSCCTAVFWSMVEQSSTILPWLSLSFMHGSS